MVIERVFERAARALGVDAVELRRRNVITDFPYKGVNNITYDPGPTRSRSTSASGCCARRAGSSRRSESPTVGIGFACFSERTGYGSGAFAQRKMQVVPGFDVSEIRMDLDGTVAVTSGTLSHGQSHETTMAQIVADRLGIPYQNVKIVQGDTDRILYGWGSFASRSITVGGSAVAASSEKLGRAAPRDRRAPAGGRRRVHRARRGRRGAGGRSAAVLRRDRATSPTCARTCCPRASDRA